MRRRRTPALGGHVLERLRRCGRGRHGGHRTRLRGRPSRRSPGNPDPAGDRRSDGTARRRRRVRSRDRPLYPPCRRRRGGPAQARARRDTRGGGGPGAGGGRRCRRQLRHPERVLSRIRPGGLGRQAPRPSRQVDGGSRRIVCQRLPGPRPRGGRGARPRRRRPVPRDARFERQQCRGAHRLLRAADQGRRDHDRALRCAGRRFPGPRRGDQHAAHQPLSQRRPARGHVRSGEAGRHGGRHARLRPGCAAAREPGAGERHAVCQPARHDLRQRRLRNGDGCRDRRRRLGRIRRTQATGVAAAEQVPRHRHRQLYRDVDRCPAGEGRDNNSVRRSDRRRHRHLVERAGPRDELRPARGRVVRRRPGRGEPDHRRHRYRLRRRRFPFRTVDASRRDHDGQGDRRDRGPGAPDRGLSDGSGGRGHRLRG